MIFPFGIAGGAQPLTWAIRMKVAIGAAKGLTFLHDAKSQVIYRDFKAANILLDAVITLIIKLSIQHLITSFLIKTSNIIDLLITGIQL